MSHDSPTGSAFAPASITATDAELAAAVDAANIPTLQLVLAHLTSDDSWLAGEYKPSRTVALNDNDDGGFDPTHRAAIRSAVVEAVSAIRDGRRELPAPPTDDHLITLLSSSLGEPVPVEYGELMAEEGHFRSRAAVGWHGPRPTAADSQHVLIIGAGASGIAAAVQLDRLGIAHTIVERRSEIGGVWRDNIYPGAGVDTPAHLYAYSFAPNNWSRYYAKQPEVLAYLRRVADDAGISDRVLLNTEVRSVTWDDDGHWIAELDSPTHGVSTLTATAVMTCVGTLTEPSVPNFPGREAFTGEQFHSSRWNNDIDLTGKHVAIIGTGATSMQIVPAIVDSTKHTTVFQRTPQWVVPNVNYLRHVPDGVRTAMDQIPFYAAFYRQRLIWQFQDKLLATLKRDPYWEHPERSVNEQNDKHRRFLTNAMLDRLGDRRLELADAVIPMYPPYSKRILMDNEWIDTVLRDDVTLVPKGVSRLTENAVVDTDGVAHPADVVVYATGFQVRKMLATVDVIGRGGVSIRDVWGDDDASAYIGVTVPDFPNLFVIGGPQTTPAHGGSAIYISECAISYALGALVEMAEHSITSIEVRREVFEEYNARVDAEHETLVWTHPGTTNWYRNSAGRVISALPWRGVDYRKMTEHPDLDDYVVVHHREQVGTAV